jgi:FkbM family methyltransferase
MKVVDGWMCPDLLSGPGSYLGRCADVDLAVRRVSGRQVAIQAGGHIGTVPCYLAGQFKRVYTFEPDPENFAALAANCHARHPGRIWCAQGVLGNKRRPVGLRTSTKSTGQHRVAKGGGHVPTYRIDDLGLDDVGAIFLDVEGFEIPALQGAHDTIQRCQPVIMAELNKRAVEQGFRLGDLAALMALEGYSQAAAIADDLVFTSNKAR